MVRIAIATSFVLLLAACGPSGPTATPEHVAEIEQWKADRDASLRRSTGYLAIVALGWLEPGDNTVGAFDGATVRLPDGRAPAAVGVFTYDDGVVSFTPAPDVDVVVSDGTPVTSTIELASDADGEATMLVVGELTMWVIERGDRVGVRVRDPQSPILADFPGATSFAVDGAWRKIARFEALDAPRDLDVPNILGSTYADTTWGDVVFDHDGDEVRLVTTGDPSGALFVIFGDDTNGEQTYGGGRFLAVPSPDADGTTLVDFNRAYNPPCAFSPYTTCPMPPPGNVLPFAVEAGETLDA